jgi:O-acetyl-ADP-ribose deacetylase (regulator of RNase III)
LPARWVIHTVGPVHSTKEDRGALLCSAYRSSLRVAEDLGARSIAFPAVSAGAYAWPVEDAARIAVTTVRAHEPGCLEEARFVLFSRSTYAAFRAALGAADDQTD